MQNVRQFGHLDVPTGTEPLNLTWQHPQGMVGLSFINIFFRIITLGIYHFWGKTEVRRRIWSAIRLNGEPLQYTGTGKELFLGFLVVFGVVLLPLFILNLIAGVYALDNPSLSGALQLGVSALIFILLGFGIYRAQRFRLSRTRWRGIRGGLDGSAGRYAWSYIWTGLLVPITLGWIIPWRAPKLHGLLVNNMRFGTRPLQFAAPSGPLYGRFALLWVGGVMLYAAGIFGVISILGPSFTQQSASGKPPLPPLQDILAIFAIVFGALLLLSIISASYQAKMLNHFAAHTHFEGAKFKGTATAGGLIWLAISNFLLGVLSLGILAPVAQARAARYRVENLAIEGRVPLAAIAQGAAQVGGYGEGIAQAFDFDAV